MNFNILGECVCRCVVVIWIIINKLVFLVNNVLCIWNKHILVSRFQLLSSCSRSSVIIKKCCVSGCIPEDSCKSNLLRLGSHHLVILCEWIELCNVVVCGCVKCSATSLYIVEACHIYFSSCFRSRLILSCCPLPRSIDIAIPT